MQVDSIVLPGSTVERLSSKLRRTDLHHIDFVVLHVGECDVFDRDGRRRAFPNQVVYRLLDLKNELEQRGVQVVISGLLPKVKPTTDTLSRAASRYGITRYTSKQYSSAARKINKKLRQALLETTGHSRQPVVLPEFWFGDGANPAFFDVDCVHLLSAGATLLARALHLEIVNVFSAGLLNM